MKGKVLFERQAAVRPPAPRAHREETDDLRHGEDEVSCGGVLAQMHGRVGREIKLPSRDSGVTQPERHLSSGLVS